MNAQVSQDQADFYQENGYVVIENFLDAEELEHWRHTTQDAVDQRLAVTSASMNNQNDPGCVLRAGVHAMSQAGGQPSGDARNHA